MRISESRLTRAVKRFVNIEQDKVNIPHSTDILQLIETIFLI